MSRRILVVSAGLSNPSTSRLLAEQIGEAVRSQVGARGEAAEVEYVDLRDHAVQLAQALTTGGMPIPALDALKQKVTDADALVAVSPVFAASYSGLFKMFVDLLDPDALTGTPVLIAATAGTPRHSLVLDHAMRPLFSYLRAVVVPTGVFAATEDFGGGTDLTARVHRAAGELAGLVVADRAGVVGFAPAPADHPRKRSGVALDTDVTPFEELLRGHEG